MKADKIIQVPHVLLGLCIATYGAGVERQTSLGAVSGKVINVLNTTVEEYMGIPYAKPPVGDLRFMPPAPNDPWQGTYNATQLRTGCPQVVHEGFMAGEVTYSEDCLHLNVWTSRLQSQDQQNTGNLSPVLVWIHGGGFSYGSAAYDNYTGSVLCARTGFVVVSMNYRLGALGFLDANYFGAPGNMGLMDQVLALRWVTDNIRFFGGDSSKVTLFGHSAGALSVHCHLLSPMSRGLFSMAVLLSGSMYTLDFYDTPQESYEKADRLAERVGCNTKEVNLTTHPEQVLRCLRKIPADDIVTAGFAVARPKILPFLPTYHNEFLPKEPLHALKRGFFSKVDLIVGVVSDELSIALLYPPNVDFLQDNLEGLRPDKVQRFLEATMGAWVKHPLPEALEHYVEGAKNSSIGGLVRQYINHFSDRIFNCPAHFLQKKHASRGSKVFSCIFDHKYHTPPLPSWMGTPHAGELVFLFGFPLVPENDIGVENQALSEALSEILASFADSGYPKLPGNNTWPEYSEHNPVSVVLAPGNYTEVRDYRGTECEYWTKYF